MKKFKDNKKHFGVIFVYGYEQQSSFTLLPVALACGTGTVKNRRTAPPKTKNRVPSAGCLPQKFENICLLRYIHPCVHCSIVHGGQEKETTKLSFDR